MGTVVSIAYTPRAQAGRPHSHYVRIPADAVELVADRGIKGDAKARPGNRQINIMCAEVFEALQAEGFRTAPGEMGEQVVVRGIVPDSLYPSAVVRIGEATVEVTIPRTGCERFETIQGRPRKSVEGRLGVLVKVLAGGTVRVGDVVAYHEPVPSLPSR